MTVTVFWKSGNGRTGTASISVGSNSSPKEIQRAVGGWAKKPENLKKQVTGYTPA